MVIEMTTTAHGPAAHRALADAIARHKRGDPLAPVTVIVPNFYAGVAARRALGRDGLTAVSFLTTYRLAELLGAARLASTGRRPVSNPVVAGAVRAVLLESPGHFTGVATHPATERALARTHRELSEVDPDGLSRLARQSERAADVVRLHRAVSARLASSFSNEQDLVDAAVEAVGAGSPVLHESGPILVYLPGHLTASQCRLLTAVAEVTTVEVILGLTGHNQADAPVLACVRRLGITGEASEGPPVPQPTRALSVSDADDEVRHAVREVVDAARNGSPLSRCAILYGTADPYARLVSDALDAAGIAWFGASVDAIERSLLGRFVLSLLGLPDNDLARRDVTAWLAAAPVRGADNRLAPVSAWERVSRRAGVISGRTEWEDRLGRLAADLEAEAHHLERDEEQAWRAERNRREAVRARELSDFVARLDDSLDPGVRGATWAGLASWCRGLIRSYVGSEGLRDGWPEAERRAAERVEAAVERIGDLDGIDPGPSVVAFRRALALELETDLGRHGRFGEGVLVGPVALGVGVEIDRVVILGMAEGTFPSRRRDDALIPDRERTTAGPDLRTRSSRTLDDHRALLAVMAAAKESVLVHPRGDLRGGAERVPSRWLLDAAAARGGARPGTDDLARTTGDWLTEVPSFVAGLRRTVFPAHRQEYDVAALLLDHDSGTDPFLNPVTVARPDIRRGMELIRARASRALTRFDGNLVTDGDLRGVELPAPTHPDEVVSATRLEAWADCPHGYFVRYVLGVNAIELPEREYRMTPLVRGDLIHRSLERWLDEAIRSDSVPPAGQPWPAHRRARLLEIGTEELAQFRARGMAGRSLYWPGDLRTLLADLTGTLDLDDHHRAELGVTPAHTELGFGMPGDVRPPVTIELPDTRTLRIRGSIDRVDTGPREQLTIIDYKTGKADAYRSLSRDDPTAGGGHLQLVLYAWAARQILDLPHSSVRGAYWFVTARGRFAVLGYSVTPEVDETTATLVASISDAIGSGLFPLHPAEPGWRHRVPCWFCEPDGLGTRDQWQNWERKRLDPALAPYLRVAEPDLLNHLGSPDV